MNLNEVETRESYSLFTGLAEIQIIAVNPDVEGLKKLFNKDEVKAPNYKAEKGGYRMDFWYKNHPKCPYEFMGKFSIWVDIEARTSKTGKKQFIDAFTKTFWAANMGEISAYIKSKPPEYRPDAKTVREARIGEEAIYELMKAYANANPKTKPFVLTDWNKIGEKGDGSELQAFFDHFNKLENPGNKLFGGIKVLLGVKDGRYQDVFTQLFLYVGDRLTDYHIGKIQGEFGFKSDYQDSMKLKEYNKELAPEATEVEDDETNPFKSAKIADPFASTANADTNPFEPAAPEEEESDDLPF